MNPPRSPQAVYTYHRAMLDQGYKDATKRTAQYFGCSRRHVLRLVNEYRLSDRLSPATSARLSLVLDLLKLLRRQLDRIIAVLEAP